MSKQSIIRMAHKYGVSDYVVGNNGCVSVKEDGYLFIKSQNTALASLSYKNIAEYKLADLSKITDSFFPQKVEQPTCQPEEVSTENTENGQNPETDSQDVSPAVAPETQTEKTTDESSPTVTQATSIPDLGEYRVDQSEEELLLNGEPLIHNSFAQDYCLYLDSYFFNAVTCGKTGKAWVAKKFGIFALWFDYQKNDADYVIKVTKAIIEYKQKYGCSPQIVFFQNRGVFFASNNEEGIDENVNIVTEAIYAEFKELFDNNRATQDKKQSNAELDKIAALYIGGDAQIYFPDGVVCSFCDLFGVKKVLADKKSAEAIMRPYTEAHKICFDVPPLYAGFDSVLLEKDFIKYVYVNGFVPEIIVVKNLGFFVVTENEKRNVLLKDFFLDQIKIAFLTKYFGGGKFLPKEKIVKPVEETEQPQEAPEDTTQENPPATE